MPQPLPPERTRTDPELNPVGGRRFPVPWGLLIVLGAYLVLVLGYTAYSYWTSPDYQASVHLENATRILGRDGGRHAPHEKLIEAYRELLEAARLEPQEKELHEELESLNWRFEERHWEVPEELRHQADAVALVWLRIQQEQQPILAVGMRDRQWDPEHLLGGPARVFGWSLVGAVVIVVLWAYGRYSAKRVRAEERAEYEQQLQRELDDRARQRRSPKG